MIIDETGIRGRRRGLRDRSRNMVTTARALVLRDRNHPFDHSLQPIERREHFLTDSLQFATIFTTP